jgi:hypothetical protein
MFDYGKTVGREVVVCDLEWMSLLPGFCIARLTGLMAGLFCILFIWIYTFGWQIDINVYDLLGRSMGVLFLK